MADRIEVFDVTIPAGTAQTAPQETVTPFQRARVDRLEVRIPPGPSGFVGFRVAHSGQSIIPRSGTAWVVADNVELDWDMDNYPTGDAWSIIAYNTGTYSHTLQFRFHLTEFGAPDVGVVAPIAIQPIATAEDVGATMTELADIEEAVG